MRGRWSAVLAELVRRHEVLRTRFESVEGQPFQLIDPPERFELHREDLSQQPAQQLQAEVQRRIEAEVRERFDLQRGPLFRASLLRLSDAEHVLLVTMHHVVSDGWSMGILMRELSSLYAAYREGRPSPLAELPVQYADYALWQRGWLQGAALHRQLEYWRSQLAGAPAALELPTDRPRPAVASFKGAMLRIAIPKEISEALAELARQHNATLFMTVLAAFQVLLSRYTGQRDIVVGSPIAGRTHRQTEGLIGFFVNTLVLRTRVFGQLSFVQLLEQVKESTLGAYAHQDIPFEKLVAELHPQRDLSRQPLFQVSFRVAELTPRRSGAGRAELAADVV